MDSEICIKNGIIEFEGKMPFPLKDSTNIVQDRTEGLE